MSEIEGFAQQRVETGEVCLNVLRGGSGHPLVLLHGYPQNHRCWRLVAPEFARHFDVIVPDLRGYGDSDAPADDTAHTRYSKRTMAADIVGLLDALDIPSAHILGHDRGARVAYRLAFDHPDRVARLGILEVVPTADLWANLSAELALDMYHWMFLAQPAPFPERMIGADPAAFTDWTLQSWTQHGTLDPFKGVALDSYRAQARSPERVAAMCADYRAGATTDRALDEQERANGRKIAHPLHFVYAKGGFPDASGDPTATWRNWADTVTAQAVTSGHFVAEENPKAVLEAYLPFFLPDG